MCKILVATGIDRKITDDKAFRKFVMAATVSLVAREKDGFGYAAHSPERGLFGERWVNVDHAFATRLGSSSLAIPVIADLGEAVQGEATYCAFGNLLKPSLNLDDVTSILLHSRTSTNSVNIQNTHPFVDEANQTALIHNGVITNAAFYQGDVTSTCDSEVILRRYIDEAVPYDSASINAVAAGLQGWYAVAALSVDEKGPIVDVFKESRAKLVVAHIPELGENARVFCTTKEILEAACKAAEYDKPQCFEVNPGHLMRFDAETGKLRILEKFEPKAEITSYQGFASSFGVEDDENLDSYDLMQKYSGRKYRR